jgi:hypothetical protein
MQNCSQGVEARQKALGQKPLQVHTMGVGEQGHVKTCVQGFAAMALVVQGTVRIEMLGKRCGSTLPILGSITQQERLQSCDVVWVTSHDAVKRQLGAPIVVTGAVKARLLSRSKEFQQMSVDVGIAQQRFHFVNFSEDRKQGGDVTSGCEPVAHIRFPFAKVEVAQEFSNHLCGV